MTILTTLSGLTLTMGLLGFSWAAIDDMRRFIVPNRLIIFLTVLWGVHSGLILASGKLTGGDIVWTVGIAFIVFWPLFLFFIRGWIGGGDLKLLIVATLWGGHQSALGYIPLAIFLGGVVALAAVILAWLKLACYIWHQQGYRALWGALVMKKDFTRAFSKTKVPYAVAISGGIIIVLWPY